MHGNVGISVKEPNATGHQPVMRASFQKGRGWFIAATSPFAMHWTRRPHFVGVSRGIYQHRDVECFAAERDMLELGFETFFPVERRFKVTRGRKVERIKSVFGCYGFVRFDREADGWESLLHLDGNHDILRVMGIPVRVPDEFIDQLQRGEQAGAFNYTTKKSLFGKDDMVEVMEGKYAGLIGKVLSAHPRKRTKILLNALGTLEQDTCFLRKI